MREGVLNCAKKKNNYAAKKTSFLTKYIYIFSISIPFHFWVKCDLNIFLKGSPIKSVDQCERATSSHKNITKNPS